MAPRGGAAAGQKRGPGRPPKSASALKKQKLSAPTPPARASPAVESPVAATATPIAEDRVPQLPAKIIDGKPLPTLPEPLRLPISDAEYQSIAASAVLPASLDRSRLRWVNGGIFDRYWVKPETGKHAKPPPPNNPELKWMKHRGHCRIRIEPHIFEADVYVEEKVKPQPPPKQYVPTSGHNAYVQPYRPPAPGHQPYAQPHSQQHQNRAMLPPAHQHPPQQGGVVNNRPMPPSQQHSSPANQAPHQPTQQPTPSRAPSTPAAAPNSQPDKKVVTHDPVISMLASRASSDPELKALMKEVATGNASQDQLRVFQRHIDELTAIIQKQRKEEEERAAKEQQRSNVIQYDGPADTQPSTHNQPAHTPQTQTPQAHPPPAAPSPMQVPHTPTPQPPPPPPPQHAPPRSYAPPQPVPPQPPPPTYRQPAWTPPAPPSLPVILGFTTPGAIEDRFLFPQHSILETLSPQHTLVSFIVTRKGREATDRSGLDPEKGYWQPITMMVEVAYGREEILACIKRWVKPADEVRKHMEEVMSQCERAPQTFLALRLPFKSTEVVEVEDTALESTPVADEKGKSKPAAKQAKKATTSSTEPTGSTDKPATSVPDNDSTKPEQTAPPDLHPLKVNSGAPETKGDEKAPEKHALPANGEDPTKVTQEMDENKQSKRPVRKSVRISEA